MFHRVDGQVAQAGVSVLLNTPASAERLRQLGVDEVVVATGARRELPDLPGADRDCVFSGDEMRALVMSEALPSLQRKTSTFSRVLIRLGAISGVTRSPSLLRRASRYWLPLPEQVTIIGADLVGLELAEFLAERGRAVTVLSEGPSVGQGLYLVRRLRLLEELRHLGVTLLRDTSDIAIEQGQVTYTNYRG